MSKKPLTEYEKLRAVWYAKLKKEGFDDIETDEYHLKTWSSKFASKKSQELWRSKEAYYYMTTTFLNDYKFESKLEKIIWEYHSEAISVRDIVKLLRSLHYRKIGTASVDRNSVWAVIHHLETIMKNMYLNKQSDQR